MPNITQQKRVAVVVRIPQSLDRAIEMEGARIDWTKQRFLEAAARAFLQYTMRRMPSQGGQA